MKPKRCKGCPFTGGLCGSRGPEDSPFVIIGESPGREEVKTGLPFSGPSGMVLNQILKQYPDAPEPYITNALKCYPGTDDKQEKLAQGCHACRDTLLEEITRHPRKVILALGNGALWSATNQYELKITQVRGQCFQTDLAEIGAVAAVHPAFLLRGGGSYQKFKADIDYAIRLLQHGSSHLKNIGEVTWELLDTPEKIREFIRQHQQVEYIIADLETTGFSHVTDEIICAGYTINGEHSYIVPTMDVPELLPLLADIQAMPAKFVWQNGKFDSKFLRRMQGTKGDVDEDTLLLSYSLDETRGIHGLEQIAGDLLGAPDWKKELKKHIPKGGNYSHVPRPMLYRYLAYDLKSTHGSFHIMRSRVQNDRLSNLLYTRTLIPASNLLVKVEENGLLIDPENVLANYKKYTALVNERAEALNALLRKILPLRAAIFDAVKKPNHAAACRRYIADGVNPNSSKQLAEIFFDLMMFKTSERSTEEDIIKEIEHPLARALLDYRKVQKAVSTYIKPYLNAEQRKQVNLEYNLPKQKQLKPGDSKVHGDGRVHQTYLIHGTATGRLSSRDPNVQNIPRDPILRGQFVAPEGYVYLEPDLNQAELRSLACLSGDPELCKIYLTEGMSLHEEVRAEIFGHAKDWSPADVQRYLQKFYIQESQRFADGADRIVEEQKMKAKNVNFGIVYGITPYGLADQAQCTVADAEEWLTRWAKKFHVAWDFINLCREAPLRNQNLITPFGYRKRIGIVTRGNIRDLQNQCANFPHQSIASTINLHGAIEAEPKMRSEFGARLVNLVHDSTLWEVPNDREVVTAASLYMRNTLEAIPPRWGLTRIPFKADAKIAKRWGRGMSEKKWWAAQEKAA